MNLNEIHSANKVFGVRFNFSGQTGMKSSWRDDGYICVTATYTALRFRETLPC